MHARHLPHNARPSAASLLLLAGAALAAVGLARSPQTGGPPANPPQETTQVISMPSSAATADSNNRMIAVTGVDVTGASILFLVDTEKMRLAVYQASGSGSGQGVRFVGARRIELDMEVDGFNDKSDLSYKQLKDEFAKQGWNSGSATGVVPQAGKKNGGGD